MTGDVPLRILILALGGEGGGVLMNWIVAAARESGLAVQATSVPGVAQRTGSTSYYVEIAPEGTQVVLGLMPMPGRVDVVVASELVEAARAMEAGFVSDRLTTLVASTNRVYATSEKIDMADGRFDAERIVAAAKEMAKCAHLMDLDRIAREKGTFISATLFGALAGSGVLPWDRAISEKVIGSGARAEASLAGFGAAFEAISVGEAPPDGNDFVEDEPETVNLEGVPEALQKVVALGRDRVVDHQDEEYGALYLNRVRRLVGTADPSNHRALAALEEAARRLALWMAYEDIARVADLKTRPERFERIRSETQIEPGQILKVTEYLKPRAEEVADMLPVRLGERIMARVEAGKSLPFFGRGLRLRSNGAIGFLMLRGVARMRAMRRKSLRYAREQQAIEEWLELLAATLPSSPGFAEALAALPRLRKGYSDTLVRGLRAYDMIVETVVRPAVAAGPGDEAIASLRGAIAAALSDDSHGKLERFLAGQLTDDFEVPVLRDKREAISA